MVGRDRTSEFFDIVHSLLPPGSLSGGSKDARLNTQPVQSVSVDELRFTTKSSAFDSDLCKAEEHLAKLRELAKNSNLFDDKTDQIQYYTYELKKHLNTLNTSFDELASINSSSSATHVSQHHQAVVDSLRNRLITFTGAFRDVLELRTKNMQRQETRRRIYQPVMAPVMTNQAVSSSVFGSPILTSAGNGWSSSNSSGAPNETDLESGNQQQQVLQQRQGAAYQQARVEGVEQVQRVLAELSTMFQRVASLVSRQDEMVMRIDANVSDSLHNLKEGQAHLLKYLHRISSNRALILKILGIIMAFAVFFIVFLA